MRKQVFVLPVLVILILSVFFFFISTKNNSELSNPSPEVYAQTTNTDWPTVAHDVQRTGHAPTEVRPPFTELWNKTWEGEMFATRVEAIVSGNKVFVGSYSGKMHALDTTTGTELWTFTTDNQAGIAHSPAVSGDTLVFGSSDGKIYALNLDGNLLWKFSIESRGRMAGFTSTPAVFNNTVYLGSRDGYFYAVNLKDGSLVWEHQIGAPIYSSAAVADGVVYIGAEDMHAYALDATTGTQIWQSNKFYGMSQRDYFPVIAGETILFTTNILANLYLSQIYDFIETLGNDDNQAVIDYLNTNPYQKSVYALERSTGVERFTVPVIWEAGNNGLHSPPTVLADGRVMILYRNGTNYNVWGDPIGAALGELDLSNGYIHQVIPSETPGVWLNGWGFFYVETNRLSSGGNVLYNTHQGNPAGMDLSTKDLFKLPGVRDTWGGYLRPTWIGNEWHGPARGSISISNNRYYWVTGSRLIAIQGQ